MDKGVTDGKPEMKNNGSPQKVGNEDHAGGENDCELNSLLPPSTGGMSRKPEKKGRKVRWNDSSGNKLFEVLEFHPR